MHTTDWMVIVAGLGTIALVNWYFFLADGELTNAIGPPAASAAADRHDPVDSE